MGTLKKKHRYCCTSCADSLTVNQQRQRQTSVSQMTGGKDETWSPAGMSVARRQFWSVVADCSMPALHPQGTRSHQAVINYWWECHLIYSFIAVGDKGECIRFCSVLVGLR